MAYKTHIIEKIAKAIALQRAKDCGYEKPTDALYKQYWKAAIAVLDAINDPELFNRS